MWQGMYHVCAAQVGRGGEGWSGSWSTFVALSAIVHAAWVCTAAGLHLRPASTLYTRHNCMARPAPGRASQRDPKHCHGTPIPPTPASSRPSSHSHNPPATSRRVGRTGRLAAHGHAYSFFTRNLARIAPPLVALLQAHGQAADPNLVALAEAWRLAEKHLAATGQQLPGMVDAGGGC